jgi:hypothetical protein
MFDFHVGPPRGPAADGKEAMLTHLTCDPFGPRLSAALVAW